MQSSVHFWSRSNFDFTVKAKMKAGVKIKYDFNVKIKPLSKDYDKFTAWCICQTVSSRLRISNDFNVS